MTALTKSRKGGRHDPPVFIVADRAVGLKSALALGINVALLTVWVELLSVPAELAAVVNAALIPPFMYVVTDRWVFSDAGSPTSLRGHVKQFAGMYAANSSAKVGNYAIFVVLINFTMVSYQAAWVIGAVVMFVGSFLLNRHWWGRVGVAS
jgi:putative flippase GtrA